MAPTMAPNIAVHFQIHNGVNMAQYGQSVIENDYYLIIIPVIIDLPM